MIRGIECKAVPTLQVVQSASTSVSDSDLTETLRQRRVLASVCFFALDVFNVMVMGVGLNLTQPIALSAIIYAWFAGIAIVVYIHRIELIWEELYFFGNDILAIAEDPTRHSSDDTLVDSDLEANNEVKEEVPKDVKSLSQNAGTITASELKH